MKHLDQRKKTELRQQLGERIKAAMQRKGLTTEQLAALLDMNPRNLERIESGNFAASADLLNTIADAIDHHIDIVPDE